MVSLAEAEMSLAEVRCAIVEELRGIGDGILGALDSFGRKASGGCFLEFMIIPEAGPARAYEAVVNGCLMTDDAGVPVFPKSFGVKIRPSRRLPGFWVVGVELGNDVTRLRSPCLPGGPRFPLYAFHGAGLEGFQPMLILEKSERGSRLITDLRRLHEEAMRPAECDDGEVVIEVISAAPLQDQRRLGRNGTPAVKQLPSPSDLPPPS